MLPSNAPMRRKSRRPSMLALAAAAGLLSACQLPLEPEVAARVAKSTKAKALLDERCKTAGVVIKRTVPDVEGFLLMKVIPKVPYVGKEYGDAMWPWAALAAEREADAFIKTFFEQEYRSAAQPTVHGSLNNDIKYTGNPLSVPPNFRGYRYVDVVDAQDGLRYRYTVDFNYHARTNHWDAKLQRTVASGPEPRYALDIELPVDPADREMWVAKAVLKVIDRSTSEVIATKTQFVLDGGQGSNSGYRSPWLQAATSSWKCPKGEGSYDTRVRFFVDTVLLPKCQDPPVCIQRA